MKDQETKSAKVTVYLKDINSYYSFLDWIKNNFDENLEKRKDIATLMLILLKKITDDSIKQLSFHEKEEFQTASKKLEVRIRKHYEKKNE